MDDLPELWFKFLAIFRSVNTELSEGQKRLQAVAGTDWRTPGFPKGAAQLKIQLISRVKYQIQQVSPLIELGL